MQAMHDKTYIAFGNKETYNQLVPQATTVQYYCLVSH